MENKKGKKGIMEKLTDFIIDVIVPPLNTFANYRPMLVIRGGLVATMPVILASSVFLVLGVLASPLIGGGAEGGITALPFLAPLASRFMLVNSFALGFIALYASIALGSEFADVYGVPKNAMVVMAPSTFFAFVIGQEYGAAGSIGHWGGVGLFTAFIAVFWSGFVLQLCIKKKLIIKLPDTVPPNIANSFSAIIPAFLAILGGWIIQSLLNIDLPTLIRDLLAPVIGAADSAMGYSFVRLLAAVLWSVGVHGDNVIAGVVNPMQTMWIEANATAAIDGVPLNQLPHVWTMPLHRSVTWVAGAWPVLFMMFLSKVRAHKALAKTALPSAVFGIIEPILFGLPIVMNPLLMLPFLVSIFTASLVSYLMMATGFFNLFFINLPWATPPPIMAVVASGGDFRNLIIVIVAFLIGLVIYWPFFKVLEKQELLVEQNMEKELARVADESKKD